MPEPPRRATRLGTRPSPCPLGSHLRGSPIENLRGVSWPPNAYTMPGGNWTALSCAQYRHGNRRNGGPPAQAGPRREQPCRCPLCLAIPPLWAVDHLTIGMIF